MNIHQLKPFVPKQLWNGARRIATFGRRLHTWRLIKATIHGVSPADRRVLTRSFMRGVLGSIRKLDDWQDPVLTDDATVRVPDIGQFRVRAYSDDLYHVLPAREPAILRHIQTRLHAGDVVIDAGANIGFYAIAVARKVGPAGKVFAIEMMPDTAAILRDHIAMNDLTNIEVVERALSDRSGLKVEASVNQGKFGQASIARAQLAKDDALHRVSVTTATIDELIDARHAPITLIKMDLEGAELPALKGAGMTLERTLAVIFEQLGADNSAQSLLDAAGFAVRRLDGNNFLAERAPGQPVGDRPSAEASMPRRRRT